MSDPTTHPPAEPRPSPPTRRRLRAAGVLLVGMVIGGPAGYLLHSYQTQTGLFATNSERDVVVEAALTKPWAEPIEADGLPNLHKVSDGLYRGAQPQARGFSELAKLGVKTVVNLRSSDTDGDLLEGADLAYQHIPMSAWGITEEHLVTFLRVVGDPSRTPVFVHCWHGADRTGTLCAVYRIVVEGWRKEEAIAEMTRGGFGFHFIHSNLTEFIRDLDIEELRSRAGIDRGGS